MRKVLCDVRKVLQSVYVKTKYRVVCKVQCMFEKAEKYLCYARRIERRWKKWTNTNDNQKKDRKVSVVCTSLSFQSRWVNCLCLPSNEEDSIGPVQVESAGNMLHPWCSGLLQLPTRALTQISGVESGSCVQVMKHFDTNLGDTFAQVGLGGSLNPERPGPGSDSPPVGSRGTAEEVVINSEEITKLRVHWNSFFFVVVFSRKKSTNNTTHHFMWILKLGCSLTSPTHRQNKHEFGIALV